MMIWAWMISMTLQTAEAAPLRSYWHNREGVQKLEQKAYYPAYQTFLKALETDPLNPKIQLNLGRTFEANEEWDKAAATYKGALKLLENDPSLRFETLFNLGGVLAKQGKIDEALATYQECLDLNPESKEVKTNIELLWQGGGGQGNQDQKDQKDQKDNKDGKGKPQPKDGQGQGDKPQEPQEPKNGKKQPRPFQSQDLSPQDVKKILDEIKNQEQSIRAQEYERNGKEQGNSKDW
jgi:tetratricopeptide (TPR) repeat protein